MLQRLDFPTLAGSKGNRDWLAIMDTDGMAEAAAAIPYRNRISDERKDWVGGKTYAQSMQACHDGAPELVAQSDKFLSAFEASDYVGRRWRTVDAVAGGAVNVGAYLAGSPVSMRRRVLAESPGAPLTIFCDMTSSAGIQAADLMKRGVAVLAFARALGTTRPVTVYGVCGEWPSNAARNRKGESCFIMVRLDQPLDLSRAAFILAHPAAGRMLGYSLIQGGGVCPAIAGTDGEMMGWWPYNSVETYRQNALRLYARAINANADECCYLPPPFLKDPIVKDPAGWLKDMVAKYRQAPPS